MMDSQRGREEGVLIYSDRHARKAVLTLSGSDMIAWGHDGQRYEVQGCRSICIVCF
jgi:hypothetical protein